MKRVWQLANIGSVVFALTFNALVGAELLGLPSIKAISDTYVTLLTPANYAFSIWSLVYLLLVVFAVHQARDIFRPSKTNDLPEKLGPWFVVANICNGIWTYIFVQQWVEVSVVVLALLVMSLYIIIWRLNIALTGAAFRTIACVWWPILVYTGWVSVALVVNIASWLKSIDILITPLTACVVLIVFTSALLWLLIARNVRELLLASAWGIAAIGVKQMSEGGDELVRYSALLSATVLLVAVCVHGYVHRKTLLGKM